MATQTEQSRGGIGQAMSFDTAVVQLHEAQNLYRADKDRRPEARAMLGDAISSLFETDLAYNESELAADILLSLFQQAERDLRAAIADRLSDNPRVPLRVALSLANDEASVACRVLSRSPVLCEMDLMYIIHAQGAAHWQAVAARADLTYALIETLVEKRDENVAVTLLENDKITLADGALRVFADMARESERLQVPLVRRPELPADLVQSIYWEVGAALRAEIARAHPELVEDDTLDSVMVDAQTDLSLSTAAMIGPLGETVQARVHAARNTVTSGRLIEALRLGQMTYFTQLFADFSGLKTCMVETLLRQRGGKGLAIACRARNMDRADFMTLFMLKLSLLNTQKIVDHKELAQALAAFDRTSVTFARKMLSKAQNG